MARTTRRFEIHTPSWLNRKFLRLIGCSQKLEPHTSIIILEEASESLGPYMLQTLMLIYS